jgi:hypothetical protein
MRRRPLLLAAVLLAALTCAYTWPLVIHPGSLVGEDSGDPLIVTWILWWSTHTVPLTTAWWNAPAFYPSTGVFAFSENLLGLAPIAWPIIAVTHSPLLAYNAAFVASYVFCGLGAYFLGYVLTKRHDAALVAAIAFAFAPYRLSHTHHLQLLSSYWMPVAIAALHLYGEDERPRWAALFAVSWLLQALSCGYYFFYLTLFAALWLAWFTARRVTRRGLIVLGAWWFAAGIVIAPVMLGYLRIQSAYGFQRSPAEIVFYSADIAGLWAASPLSLVWRGLQQPLASSESQQFPGVTILVLLAVCVAAAVRRRIDRRTAAFYALTAVVMWALSLGPEPRLHGAGIGIPGPYTILTWLPGFNGMRVPARLWMVSLVCLSAAAALACASLASARGRRAFLVCAICGLVLDGWPRPLPVHAAPPMIVTKAGPRARLQLPLRENESEAMYGAIAQDRPVFNGYSGYAAPQHAALADMLAAHDPRILDRIAATDPIEVIVNWTTDPHGEWRGWLDSYGAIRSGGGDGWTSYDILPTGFAAPPPVTGTPIAVASITTSTNEHDIGAVLDGDVVTRWHAPRQEGHETITLDLGSRQRVRAVVMCLGAYPSQYPRGLHADISSDGRNWREAAAGNTVLATYDAALVSPKEVPVTIPIERDNIRYIRLRQTAVDDHSWSIVELRVVQ